MQAPTSTPPKPAAPKGGRSVSLIVVHCAAVPDGRWTSVEDIDSWHVKAGFHRDPAALPRQNPSLTAIGYHFVIYTNGAIATGRHLDEPGAHAIGFNGISVGICMIGTRRFRAEQWSSLAACVRSLAQKYSVPLLFAPERGRLPGSRDGGICGHRDLSGINAQRECPGFSVEQWIGRNMTPAAENVLEAPR